MYHLNAALMLSNTLMIYEEENDILLGSCFYLWFTVLLVSRDHISLHITYMQSMITGMPLSTYCATFNHAPDMLFLLFFHYIDGSNVLSVSAM